MHKVLHLRDDVHRLYVLRKEGGSGFASIEDSVVASINRLEDNIEMYGGRVITAPRHNTDKTRSNWTTISRKQKWQEKQLYGCFKRLMCVISREKTWMWLRKGNLTRETESLLIAAQNNAIRTNHIKVRIDKAQQNSRDWLCGDRDETINHTNECSKLAQRKYKTRHDWVG